MRKIIAYINSTFTGVVTGDPKKDKSNFMECSNDTFMKAGTACLLKMVEMVDTVLLSRVTYEDLSGPDKWPSVKDWPGASDATLALGERINQTQLRPVVINVGRHLFDGLKNRKDFRIADLTLLDDGTIFMKYGIA